MPHLLTIRFEDVGPNAEASVVGTRRPYYGLMRLEAGPEDQDVPVSFNLFHQFATATEFESAWRSYAALEQLFRDDLRGYVERSFVNLEFLVHQLTRAVEESRSVPQSVRMVAEAEPEIRCAVLTFAVSVRVFADQLTANFKRIHGKDSAQVSMAASQISAIFDNSFDYRVIYKLRNVLVHHSLSAVGISVHRRLVDPAAGLTDAGEGVVLRLHRERVYEAKDGLRGQEVRRLRTLRQNPDLLEMCRSANEAVRRIAQTTLDIAHPGIDDHLQQVMVLDALFGRQAADRAFVAVPDLPPAFGGTGPNELPHYPLDIEVFNACRAILVGSVGSQGSSER